MIKKKFIFCLLLVSASVLHCFAQQSNTDPGTQIVRVIPASPTAAGLGSYGNTPIGYYTGTPNVNIPLFDLNSGDIKLPVNISHHGGGIKVEEMASWVGLGWSLNAGGVITRQVRGIPDDAAKGAFNTPMTIRFLNDNMDNPAYQPEINDHIKEAAQGLYDLECDIFSFNFGGQSGRFIYDQETQEFYTIPRMNLKVEYNRPTKDFTITTEEGNKYLFSTKEYTKGTGSICTPVATAPPERDYDFSTSTWYLTKVEDGTSNNITFDYESNYYTFQNTVSSTGYILKTFAGNYSPQSHPPDNPVQDCYQLIVIEGQKLSTIHFKNGYLKFNATTPRCDLVGDELLDNIELYDNENILKRRFTFKYGYFGDIDQPVNCGIGVGNTSIKLKLKSITEENTVNSALIQKKPHVFEYNENGGIPDRLSFAQDHWGYYNGATTNTSLIPTTYYDAPVGPMWWPGANRNVNPSVNQSCSLSKIIYPTGGDTEFEYESNVVNDNTLYPMVQLNEYSIEGDHNGGIQNMYESQPFVVNVPPGYLNGNNPNGGAFVTIKFSEIGNCGYNNPNQPNAPTTCAVLTLERVNGATALGPLAENLINRYLPNGTYKLKANFSQNPPGYEDFYMWITWNSVQPGKENSQYAGGLRLKKTTDHDGIDHAKDVIRNFSYDDDNGISTGKINGMAPNYTSDYEQRFFSGWNIGNCVYMIYDRTYIKRTSYSNYPLLTSSGSYVGYSKVTIKYGTGNNLSNGKTEYTFKNEPLDAIHMFPHPVTTFDWQRGQTLEEKQSRLLNNSTEEITKTNNSYEIPIASTTFKSIMGIKTGFKRSCVIDGGACIPILAYQTQQEYLMPVFEGYDTYTDYLRNTSITTTVHDQADNNKAITATKSIQYNDLNYQPSSVITSNSQGEEVITKTLYAKDYPAGTGSFIYPLLERNMVSVPIESYTIVKKPNGDQFVTSAVLTTYKTSQAVKDKVYKLDITEPLPLSQFVTSYYSSGGAFVYDSHYKEEISFNQFDGSFNILEQQKKNDVLNSYVWDYNNSLPVAEVINGDNSSVAYTSFETSNTGGFSFSGSQSVDASSPTGKKCYNISNGSITKSGLANGDYTVSYWSKNGACTVFNASSMRIGKTLGGWTYYEHMFSGTSVTIAGGGYIDELRLYPKGAQMKTYTYDPLIGVTSQCDAASNIIYYEYEPLGRLKLIRDENKNILKQYYYDYQASAPNTAPLWQTTGLTRCKPCPQNSNYITNILQNQEIDNNPESGTSGQTRWTDAGISSGCDVNADWQNTATAVRCKLNGNGQNTGEVEQEQMNMNPCHSTYGQTRWIVTGVNNIVCPLPVSCNSGNCTGVDKKCVNNICETGSKVYTSAVRNSRTGLWTCTYHYTWSDQSISGNYTETSSTNCLFSDNG